MTPASPRAADRGPDVKFPPPLLFAGGLGLGMLLDRVLPALIPATLPLQWAGIVLGVVGLTLVYAGIITFRRARTAVYPNRPAKQMVSHGIYAHTRNPMYVGMTVFYLGGVLVLASPGALLLLPLVHALLFTFVIAREERYMRHAFPQEYAAYCVRVRRWL